MNIKIRPLKIKDGLALIKIMRRLISEMKQTWLSGIVSDKAKPAKDVDKEEELQQLGQVLVSVIEKALQFADEDVTGWFASLCEVTYDEFSEYPINAHTEVIKQIKEDDNFKDFLSGLSAVFNVKEILLNAQKALKDRFPSIIA